MSTGYFKADWRDGGSVPGTIGTGAGAIFAQMDYLFLNGPNPWTKVNVGTNIESYQAPAGSQVKLIVYDEYPISGGSPNSYYTKVQADVGGQVFPTPSQEATTNPGKCTIIKSYANNIQGWIGIRTDRLAMFISRSTTTNCPDSVLVVGDLPIIDPNDPGCCALLGWCGNYYPSTSSSANTTNWENSGTTAVKGFLYNNKQNTTFSCPAYHIPTIDGLPNLTANLSEHNGSFNLFPMLVSGSRSQSNDSSPIPRAWVPWLYHLPFYIGATFLKNAVTAGDTFSAGSATFELQQYGQTTIPCALMTNDQEPLP
jgi:hypothetical protein